MTDPFSTPPDLIDLAGERWVKLRPQPGQIMVPLGAEDLAGLAAHYRARGTAIDECRAFGFEQVNRQLDLGDAARFARGIRVVIHGADDGFDQFGRHWVLTPPIAATAPPLPAAANPPTGPVALSTVQVMALATWHQQQVQTAATPDDASAHQREASRLVQAALHLQAASPAPPAPRRTVVATVDVSAEELVYLADGYAERARAANDEGAADKGTFLASRALTLRNVAHTLKPVLSLEFGDPRFPGLSGAA